MKSISSVACILGLCFVAAAWAQQPETRQPSGAYLQHRVDKANSGTTNSTTSGNLVTQWKADHPAKVWELGTYPGGTWVTMGDINDFGVAVGMGDVPPIDLDTGVGETRTLAVPLFGPHAGQWIDLGTLGGTSSGWEEPLNRISNTGLVVGHSPTASGYRHGFAWTEKSGMVDLGTLADIGYTDYNSSNAWATNKLGTLIVGSSGVGCPVCVPSSPVVWTPSIAWKNGQLITQWKIHKLDTTGFPDFVHWYAWGVNDFGQIIAHASDNENIVGIPVLWNPRPNGKGWKLTVLPQCPDCPDAMPYCINDRGEITGVSISVDWNWLPVFWKPLNPTRNTYSQPIALALPDGFSGGYADGINELGDMTGELWGDAGDQAFRWSTRDPGFVEVLGFPSDWSWSFGVSNTRVAVVTYGGANCSTGSCGGAIQIH